MTNTALSYNKSCDFVLGACNGTNPFFAAALSDGTIARMSAKFEDDTLLWGVCNDLDQVIISYPAIGLVPVDLRIGTHIACCLRGGTVYLIPQSDTLEPIKVILGPIDAEHQPSVQYLQGFTAGNISVNGITSTTDKEVPVLIYSSDGGILKVYACLLLSQTEQDCVLQELVNNGSAQLLREFLCSLEDDNPQLRSDIWKKSRHEMMQTNDETLSFETLCSSSFVHTRKVLMDLSETL